MKYSVFGNLESEKSKMNYDSSLTSKNDAEIIVSSNIFQRQQQKKLKRYRSAFTTEQIFYLESEFKKFPYIGSVNRKEVANTLNISERAVKIWFQNRRMKEKREVNSYKELIIDDKNRIFNAFSNDQVDSRNVYLRNDCSTNEIMLSSRCQKYLKESNLETRKAHCTLNDRQNVNDQLKEEAIEMPKDIRKTNKFESTLGQKVSNHARNVFSRAQRNKHNKQHIMKNELKNQVNNSIKIKQDEIAQDLSLKNSIKNPYHPINSYNDKDFLPLLSQAYYVHQPVAAGDMFHSGNIIWKPVNMMPILSGLPATTATVDHNHNSRFLNKEVTKEKCSCHGPSQVFNAQMQRITRKQPQYILAIPINTSSQ